MARRPPDIEELYRLAAGELDAERTAELNKLLETSDEERTRFEMIKEQSTLVELLRLHKDTLPVEETDSSVEDLPALPPGYRFDAMLRRGGQALVVKAIQESTDRTVALKIITGEQATPNAAARMELEFEVIRRLQHPSIVRLYDSGQVQGLRFLAMEFIEGRHLDVWLEDEDPPLSERVALTTKICRAVHFAHQRGVIHRDLKPSNIIIDGDGDPHVLDFGIAKPTFDAMSLRELTKTGEFAGTLPYASPEQLSGDPDLVDIRTDVHALGLLLYESLAQRHAWHAHGSIADLIRAITDLEPDPVTQFNRGVDEDLEAITMCALAKDPDRRYQSAEALERDLRRWLSGDAVEARGQGRWYLLRKTLAKHRLLVVATTLVFLVLAAATGVSWSFWKQEQDAANEARREKERVAALFDQRLQLSDILKLRRLVSRHPSLWPVGPDLVIPCERWLAEADALEKNESAHAQSLKRLRERALPYSDDERALGHPEDFTLLQQVRAELSTLSPDEVDRRKDLEASREELENVVEMRLHWSYADEGDQFFEEQLEQLIDLYVQLDDAVVSVRDRLERSRTFVERTVDLEKEAWDTCIADLSADSRFKGVTLAPVPGLVPLGKDGSSKLWAFWHVETGSRPLRDEQNDRWVPGIDGGLVLLLLPPGSFYMGAVLPPNAEETGDNIDPFAEEDSGPVHEVRLGALWMSQYEMTEAQWRRFLLRERGEESFGDTGTDAPAGYVSWREAARVMEALRLELPTEAQWEYAARAGTRTVFPSGTGIPSLEGFANIFDAASYANQRLTSQPTPDFDDGHQFAAPVGTFTPNRFGLYDVIGNVAEWCRDSLTGYSVPARSGDGLRSSRDSQRRIDRGGSFLLAAPFCTSAYRHYAEPDERAQSIGVRPSLTLDR